MVKKRVSGAARTWMKGVTVRIVMGLMVLILLSSSIPAPASADDSGGWTHCANEGETCAAAGTKEIRFGADGSYVKKVINGAVTCSAAALEVADPAVGIVKSCDIRNLQLGSGVSAVGSGDHRSVAITFKVYAAQAGTLADLRSKMTVRRTGESVFSPLGENDIVSNLTSSPSSSSLTITFEQALAGSDNVIVIDEGAFADSGASPYNQIVTIEGIQFGVGTASSPYEIATADHLNKVRYQLGRDVYYKLTADIDLSGYASFEGWVPIANDMDAPFQGHLDGNGYTIRRMTITRPSDIGIGLVGFLGGFGVLANMKLEDVAIDGNAYVGGLVGFSKGTISNSYVTGSVKGNTYVGGLVGTNMHYAPIRNSYAAVTVQAGDKYIGGLVGSNNGDIISSYAKSNLSGGGNQVGGLVGVHFGRINDSYAAGSVSGNSNIGGLIGVNRGLVYSSYATGSLTGGWNLGGFAGDQFEVGMNNNSYYDIEMNNGIGTKKSADDMKLQSTYAGFDFADGGGAWGIDPVYNNGYPYLKAAVAPPAVIGVSVSPAASNVATGAAQQLTAAVTVVGGAATTVTWSSSDNASVTVDANGLAAVAAHAAPGDYTLTATSTADGSKIGMATIQVTLDLSGVGLDVRGGIITGTTAAMEYSVDSTDGTDGTWTTASDTQTEVTFAAGPIYVRVAAQPTNYRLVASIAPVAAAPIGVGVDVAANQITGTTAQQEYSTNNGTTWADATATNTSHEFVGGEAILVRVKATASELASATTTAIHVAPAAGAPSDVGVDVAANQITGTTSQQEYSTNNGATWADATATKTSYNFVGGESIQVREKATTSQLASAATTIHIALATGAPSGVSVDVAANQITGTTEEQEYSTNNGATWADASASATSHNFVGGESVVVRVKATASELASASTTAIRIASAAGAPSGVGVDVASNQITGTTAQQEYSTNNGTTWADATATNTSHEFVGGEVVQLRVKATASELASAATKAIHVAPAAVAPSGVSADMSGGKAAVKLVGAAITMEYSRDGGATWQTVSSPIAAGTAVLDVSVAPNDKLHVRTAATASALASQATAKLNVGEVTSVTVSPATATIVQGATGQLTATVTVGGGAPRTVTWTSSNPKVAVDANGLVTVAADAAVGNYTVTATSTFEASHKGSATITVTAAPTAPTGGEGGGNTSTNPTPTPVRSADGTLTLPVGTTGEVSLDGTASVSIPAGAADQELRITMAKVTEAKALLTDRDGLASPIFEILKNIAGNFSVPVTLTFAFDAASLGKEQEPAVFYYDEVNKAWVKVEGGKVAGDRITVEVDHFTKFAVFAVDRAVTETTDPQPTNTMRDISGHWAEAAIKQAIGEGIVKGYQDGTFRPGQTVTRAEFAVMLMNALQPQVQGTTLQFADAATIGAWARTAIAQAVELSIITGYADGSFRPNAEITRAEMAAMLAKAAGQSDTAQAATGFADDEGIPTWAKGSVGYLKRSGIVQGKAGNIFAPQDLATRAEAVNVLLKLLARASK
ncbi:S-layer homology domain-containing protein [Paenibacillus methanolicus]|nr:S-layer homology domain-containing protein [Paenibacillus methanolicus]